MSKRRVRVRDAAPLRTTLRYVARLLMDWTEGTAVDMDAYVLGWLDSAEQHERVMAALAMFWWLRGTIDVSLAIDVAEDQVRAMHRGMN